jgi:hypothetical protein
MAGGSGKDCAENNPQATLFAARFALLRQGAKYSPWGNRRKA